MTSNKKTSKPETYLIREPTTEIIKIIFKRKLNKNLVTTILNTAAIKKL